MGQGQRNQSKSIKESLINNLASSGKQTWDMLAQTRSTDSCKVGSVAIYGSHCLLKAIQTSVCEGFICSLTVWPLCYLISAAVGSLVYLFTNVNIKNLCVYSTISLNGVGNWDGNEFETICTQMEPTCVKMRNWETMTQKRLWGNTRYNVGYSSVWNRLFCISRVFHSRNLGDCVVYFTYCPVLCKTVKLQL